MAKKEVKTDLWVANQLDKCGIQFTPQGSDVKEINEALSTASKRGTGNAGYPEYVAVVNGEMEREQGVVRSWLTDRTLYVSSSSVDDGGKESITHYRVIKRKNGYSLLELNLETGRKNQIRVHMQDLGHPIVGDGRYGYENDSNPLRRLALHAFKLCFYHPVTGEVMRFETPYPSTFKALFI